MRNHIIVFNRQCCPTAVFDMQNLYGEWDFHEFSLVVFDLGTRYTNTFLRRHWNAFMCKLHSCLPSTICCKCSCVRMCPPYSVQLSTVGFVLAGSFSLILMTAAIVARRWSLTHDNASGVNVNVNLWAVVRESDSLSASWSWTAETVVDFFRRFENIHLSMYINMMGWKSVSSLPQRDIIYPWPVDYYYTVGKGLSWHKTHIAWEILQYTWQLKTLCLMLYLLHITISIQVYIQCKVPRFMAGHTLYIHVMHQWHIRTVASNSNTSFGTSTHPGWNHSKHTSQLAIGLTSEPRHTQ